MPERPSIIAVGTTVAERSRDRLYDIEMANGHQVVGVVSKLGPHCDGGWYGTQVRVAFSPFDMSRCRIIEWLAPSPDGTP